jgi:hypothetical protein
VWVGVIGKKAGRSAVVGMTCDEAAKIITRLSISRIAKWHK